MATTTTPIYSAPHNGIVGDASATAGAGQINQFLGTHGIQAVYQGTSILTPDGTGGLGWAYSLDSKDVSQPFTLTGAVVGRVEIPVLAVGNGADLLVSLCTDSVGVPGSGGSPASVITQTRIPASWIMQLSAVTGQPEPSSVYPQLNATNSALAAARFNPYRYSAFTGTPYPFPAVSPSGVAAGPSGAYYDTGGGLSYLYTVGGVVDGATLNNVFSISASTSGAIAAAVPQPAFPQLMDGSGKSAVAVESNGTVTLVTAGGAAAFNGTPTGAVYTAAVNTATGNLGAWSAQTPLPVNIQNQGFAASGPFVYCVGGQSDPFGTVYSSVYYTQVQNSQVTGWTAATPLPTPINLPFIAAVGSYLVVAGGCPTTNVLAPTDAVYYAPINGDGSLGQWIPGPALPTATYNPQGYALQADEFGTALPGYIDNGTASIGFTSSGPGANWVNENTSFGISSDWFVSTGTGTKIGFSARYVQETAYSTPLSITPTISVPLPATGLTSGATYHVVMQQQGGDLTDYLTLWADFMAVGPFAVRTSPRGGNTWTSTGTFQQVAIQVFDQTVTGPVLHLWEDGGAKITTIVSATTPDQRPLGVCEATRQAVALNVNQGFETGLSPWTWSGGTALQSTTEVYEGAYAAQVTPSGTDATVYLESENLPTMPGQSVTVTGWMWFTSAVTANASMSVNWHGLTGAYLSTSSSNVSVPAATWTALSNAFTAPAGAYGFTICPALSGTPAAGQVFYVDVVHAHATYVGPQNSTVTQIEYAGTYPWPWPGVGTTQLA